MGIFQVHRAHLILLLIVTTFSTLPLMAAAPLNFYYSSVGAGHSGSVEYRTLFHFRNETNEPIPGELSLFTASGSALTAPFQSQWLGPTGSLAHSTGRHTFTIPPGSGLEFVLVPSGETAIGWAQLKAPDDLITRVVFQIARTGSIPSISPLPLDFEHRLQFEAELFPTQGLKSFTFPVFLFNGYTDQGAAFSIANVSSGIAEVRLTLRPNSVETIKLPPGSMLSDYFERFWKLIFPAIFPLRFQSVVQVESDAPLAVTVLRTIDAVPASGIQVAKRSLSENTVDIQLGAEFKLKAGQTGVLTADDLRITFWNIIEDSRCPIDVVCIQPGQARVELRVRKGNQDLGAAVLSSTPGLHQLKLGAYTLDLVRVEPAPISTRRINFSEYQITLSLTRD
ncbi:MAG: hypothetical protein HY645_05790 [Acidobacteria bacterium]|nr:hypothetical protein [Acidobacteriota bacterium]